MQEMKCERGRLRKEEEMTCHIYMLTIGHMRD